MKIVRNTIPLAASMPPTPPSCPLPSTEQSPLEDEVNAAPKKSVGLFDLPQELQDIIFDYAYPPVENLTLMFRASWEEREIKRRFDDNSHIIQPFPAPKVCDFMISKAFLRAAVKTWIGNQWIDYGWLIEVAGPHELRAYETFLGRFAVKVACFGTCGIARICKLNTVKKVKLEVRVDSLRSVDYAFPWEIALRDKQIKATEAYRELARLRGLTAVSCEAYCGGFSGEDNTKVSVWRSNVKRLEEIIRPIVLTPKPFESECSPTSDGLDEDIISDDLLAFEGLFRQKPSTITQSQRHESETWPQPAANECAIVSKRIGAHTKTPATQLDSASNCRIALRRLSLQDTMLEQLSSALPYSQPLNRSEIPDTKEDVVHLFAKDPARFLDWVLSVKHEIPGAIDSEQSSDDEGVWLERPSDGDATDETPDDQDALEAQVRTLTDVDLELISKTLQIRGENVWWVRPVQHADIPDSTTDLFDLIVRDPRGFASWVSKAKELLLEAEKKPELKPDSSDTFISRLKAGTLEKGEIKLFSGALMLRSLKMPQRPLKESDIPESSRDLMELFLTNPGGVVSLVKEAKKQRMEASAVAQSKSTGKNGAKCQG